MKINVGCGKRVLPGYKNLDIQHNPRNPPPDIIADFRDIPLPDECADEVLAIHVIEHVAKWEVPGVLKEWRRVLKPGGLLVLELPNLIKCCKNVIALYEGRTVPMGGKDPNQCGMWGIYGDDRYEDPYMLHKYGWTPESLTAVLHKNGFGASQEKETEWHPVGRRYRDMRIEARRA